MEIISLRSNIFSYNSKMASAHITVEQFRNKEIKTEFTAEFKIMHNEFESLKREIGAMWRIQIPIFVAILVMMFRLFGII